MILSLLDTISHKALAQQARDYLKHFCSNSGTKWVNTVEVMKLLLEIILEHH